MSRRVPRPATPLPSMPPISTPCSAAIFLTSGEDFVRTRSSNDLSLLYLSLLAVGFIMWVAYGLSIGNWVVVATNTASLTFMTVTIVVALRYRRGSARRATAARLRPPTASLTRNRLMDSMQLAEPSGLP